MRANLTVLATMLVSGLLSPACDSSSPIGLSLTAVAAAQSGVDSASRVDGVSIEQPNWRREGGFLIAEITFNNENEFPVDGVIVTCDFFDPPALRLESRGNLIPRILSPGPTTIGGIEFTMLKRNVLDRDMLGGSCSVATAGRLWPSGESASW
jgi:hypothetical protein